MNINNKLLIKEVNPSLYDMLNTVDENNILVEDSKNGEQTLAVSKNRTLKYLNSKYNPSKEAISFVESLGHLSLNKHILFVGTGLGYHIEKILSENPSLNFSIFEPNTEVLHAFLTKVDLTKYKKSKLVEIFQMPQQIMNLERFVHHLTSGSVTVNWNPSRQLEQEAVQQFETLLLEHLKLKKQSVALSYNFQEVWTLNAFKNFSIVLETPSILSMVKKSTLANKPCIIVAAGPSLSLEIENLKLIKEKKSAYIFAVGSAIKALIANGIIPDAFFSYDPGIQNYKVSEDIKEKQIPVPLIFGSTVGYKTIENYPGNLYHFITSKDPINQQLVSPQEVINDSPSIAVITLQILTRLQASPIILVGQNLGFAEDKRYAEGISYDTVSSIISEEEKKRTFEVKNVEGKSIISNETYVLMKEALEREIAKNSSIQFINTTKNGAHIEGTEYKHLSYVMEQYFKRNTVEDNWLNQLTSSNKEVFIDLFNKESNELQKLIIIMKQVINVLKELEKIQKSRLYKSADKLFVQYDRLHDQRTENLFFLRYILPMITIQHEKFVNRAYEVKAASLLKRKVDLFIEVFGSYNIAIINAVNILEPAVVEKKKI